MWRDFGYKVGTRQVNLTGLAGILQIKPISLNMGLSEINRTIKWYPERVTAL